MQVSLQLTQVGGVALDLCPAAPAPLLQAPALLALLPPEAAAQLLPAGTAEGGGGEEDGGRGARVQQRGPEQEEQQQAGGAAERGCGHTAGSFHGQWCRCTLYLEHVSLPAAAAAVGGPGGRTRTSKAHKYYVAYMLPGAGEQGAGKVGGAHACCGWARPFMPV